ncbi:hypothetical protein [Shewanella sedimentimangrovi]|uniref:Uncharacterized protein n=1 Tax=Shewanella sedimentimangrovi TaxID=2814293 RepID=A0ABX7R0G3_9GAMM|nr:hypothetical protein [Shewanella sedimentimangrovi]QSX37289.1 hypothetical protein JYB85_00035 [Shewanella sedimentimangrovi]
MEVIIEIIAVFIFFGLIATVAVLAKRLCVHLYKLIFGIYEKQQTQEILERNKLQSPQWLNYEKYLGRRIPQEFKDFYQLVAQRSPPVFKIDETEDLAIAWSELGEPAFFKRGQSVDNSLYLFDGTTNEVIIEDTANSDIYKFC